MLEVEYKNQLGEARERAKRDKRMKWDFEGAGWKNEFYSSTFRCLINGNDFNEHFRARREECHKRGQKFIILDLAASPNSFISKVQEIDGGVSVGFNDRRNITERLKDRKRNIRMIKADLLDSNTWRKMDKFMREFGIEEEGFGAITLVPIGAGTPFSPLVYFQRILRPAWRRLSNNNGEMFIEIPSRFMTSENHEVTYETPLKYLSSNGKRNISWLTSLDSKGIEIGLGAGWHSGDFSFKLTKSKISPDKLPI